MWTVNFLMFKLVLDKAEEPETKLPTFAGSRKKQESFRKTSISALLTMPKPLTVWITTNCGKFFKRWSTRQPYLPSDKPVCRSRRNRIEHGTINWFKIGKGVCQDCILSLWLSNFHAEYIMRNGRLDEAQDIIKIGGRNIITSDIQMTPTLWQKVKKNYRASWWKWKRRVKKLA